MLRSQLADPWKSRVQHLRQYYCFHGHKPKQRSSPAISRHVWFIPLILTLWWLLIAVIFLYTLKMEHLLSTGEVLRYELYLNFLLTILWWKLAVTESEGTTKTRFRNGPHCSCTMCTNHRNGCTIARGNVSIVILPLRDNWKCYRRRRVLQTVHHSDHQVVTSLLLILAGDVETNPGPGIDADDTTILVLDDINDVMDELKNVLACYEGIGERLNIPNGTLQVIQQNSSGVAAMRKVIVEWLSRNYPSSSLKPPTWKVLVDAVEHSLGGNNRAEAEEIASRHKARPSMNQLESKVGEKPVDVRDTLHSSSSIYAEGSAGAKEANLATIISRFADLVSKVSWKLKSKEIDMERLYIYIVNRFHPGDFISKTAGIVEIFDMISRNRLWSYMNYHPLEAIILDFGGDDAELNTWMKNYKVSLAGFRATTKIVEHIDTCKDDVVLAEEDDHIARYDKQYCSKLSINLKQRVTEKSLDYIDQLWRSIAGNYLLPSLSYLIEKIYIGSLVVILLIPTKSAMQILKSSHTSTSFFRQNDIISIMIEDEIIYHEDGMKSDSKMIGYASMSDASATTTDSFKDVEGLFSPNLCKDLSRHIRTDLIHHLMEDTVRIRSSFKDLVSQLRTALKKSGLTTAAVIQIFARKHPGFHEIFKDCDTIDKVFSEGEKYWSFFDYALIRLLIICTCESLNDKLFDYIIDFQKFARCQICECPSNIFGEMEKNEKVLIFKMERRNSNMSIRELLLLCSDLNSEIRPFHLRLLKSDFIYNCVQLTFRTFPCTDRDKELIKKQHPALRKLGVLNVTYYGGETSKYDIISDSGYDCCYIDEPDPALKCLICLLVAKNPMQHVICGKLFCKSCIEKHGTEKPCPHCRKEGLYYPDTKSKQAINELGVRCDNVDKSCEWEGTVYTLEHHLSKCEFALVPCPNECKDANGVTLIMKKDLEEHLKNCSDDDRFLALMPVSNKWKHIGNALGLQSTTLEVIKESHGGDITEAIFQVVSEWLAMTHNVKRFADDVARQYAIPKLPAPVHSGTSGSRPEQRSKERMKQKFKEYTSAESSSNVSISEDNKFRNKEFCLIEVVYRCLKDLSVHRYLELALELGLKKTDVEQFEESCGKQSTRMLVEIIDRWINQKDPDHEPSWKFLKGVLERMKLNTIACTI